MEVEQPVVTRRAADTPAGRLVFIDRLRVPLTILVVLHHLAVVCFKNVGRANGLCCMFPRAIRSPVVNSNCVATMIRIGDLGLRPISSQMSFGRTEYVAPLSMRNRTWGLLALGSFDLSLDVGGPPTSHSVRRLSYTTDGPGS